MKPVAHPVFCLAIVYLMSACSSKESAISSPDSSGGTFDAGPGAAQGGSGGNASTTNTGGAGGSAAKDGGGVDASAVASHADAAARSADSALDSANHGGAKHNLDLMIMNFNGPHKMLRLEAWVYEMPAKTKVAGKVLDSIPNAAHVVFALGAVLEAGKRYQVDFFVDVNKSGKCDPQPTDHSWRHAIADVTKGVTVEQMHDTNWVSICSASGTPTP